MQYIAATCFFLSGVAGLVLEVLWTKMLTLVFGSTTLAAATTVAAFMGGLSLGSALSPRLLKAGRSPLVVYAVLEGAIGLYALAVPSLFESIPGMQSWLWPMLPQGPVWFSLARFVITFSVLLVPTTAMGATLPILSSFFVKGREDSGATVGGLYALNTAGAFAGTVAAGFLLIPALGVMHTNIMAAGIDLMVGATITAAWLARSRSARVAASPVRSLSTPPTRSGQRIILLCALTAGFASMALQILWTRALSVVIGSSTYSFTIIISAFLGGLAIGAAIYSRMLHRRRDTAGDLCMLMIFIGVSAFVCSSCVDRLPFVLQSLLELKTLTMLRLHLFNYFVTWLAIFLPTLAMGATFPLLIHIYTGSSSSVTRDVGRLYSVNTIGNILGAALAVFLIIPVLGIRSGLVAMTVVYLLLAAVVALSFSDPSRLRRRRIQAATAVLCAVAAISLAPRWNVATWSAGMFRIYLVRTVFAGHEFRTPKLVYHRDGMVTTVTVERRGESLSMKVNGKVDASNGGDMHTQILSGLWPMLLHGGARDAAMVGYGSGVTAGAILRFPLDTFRVIELESAVFEAAGS
ncbi:MAG: fused MFS/spermidine synthase, partial [Myxococcota bacterium]